MKCPGELACDLSVLGGRGIRHSARGRQNAPFAPPPTGRLAIVIIDHSAQPLTALDRSCPAGVKPIRHDQPVVQPLVVVFVMIMASEFVDGLP